MTLSAKTSLMLGVHKAGFRREGQLLMNHILLYGTSCSNFVYQKAFYYNIYPRILTKVNVSALVGMSPCTTVGRCNSGGNVDDSGGNICNSGEIEFALRNLRLDPVFYKL